MSSLPPAPVASVLDAIGNTPVVRLRRVVPEGHAEVYIKLEYFNPTGSYKDRMAKSMVEEAERRGTLKPGMTVVEATGGSTGTSLAFVCAAKGYKFRAVSSNAYAAEKLRSISAMGATVDLVHSSSGKVTPDLIPAMMSRAAATAKAVGHYPTNQFSNRDSLIGYQGIGHELVQQFPNGFDAFCGAVGIAGMVMGVAKVLKAIWPQIYIMVLEPSSSAVVSGGTAGAHGVEGIGIGFTPPLLDRDLFDEACGIAEDEARAMCRLLAKVEGIFVGTSTGLNVVGAIALAKELGPGKRVVTVACDTGLKYLNGDLFAAT